MFGYYLEVPSTYIFKQVDGFTVYEPHNSILIRIYLYLGFEGLS